MELYEYQTAVVVEIEALLASVSRICLQAATGSGKTVIASELIKRAVARGEHVLFIAHRLELIEQASRKLHAFGVDHGIIKAGYPVRLGERVQAASIQTLFVRAVRTCKIELPRADWVFPDECHHVRAMSYMRVVEVYPNARVIGLSATPSRQDGRGLGNVFQALVQCPEVVELTRLGFLVPARVFAPARPDSTGVRVRRGDYVEQDLGQRVNTAKLVGDIVEHRHRLGKPRKTVAFTVNVAHSVHLRNEFRKSGALAEHIDGSTPTDERSAILAALASGSVDVVCNCMVLTEGWDCAEASCIILARPTKSLGLFRQMVGRVLRPALGKSDAILLDHAGSVFMHGQPDDPIHWTLHEDQRAENRTHSARGEYSTPGLTTCPECHAVGTAPVCSPSENSAAISFAPRSATACRKISAATPNRWPSACGGYRLGLTLT